MPPKGDFKSVPAVTHLPRAGSETHRPDGICGDFRRLNAVSHRKHGPPGAPLGASGGFFECWLLGRMVFFRHLFMVS